jgi:hypothetical protein
MNRGGTRLAVLFCTLALQAGAVYKLVETDRKLADARTHLSVVSDQTERAARLLAEIRALQFAHVAGANLATSEPAGALFDEVERLIVALRGQVATEAAQSLGVALDHLRSLRETDGRLRTFVAAGERIMALDLSLGEAREITVNLAGQVGQAREHDARLTEARIGSLRMIEAYFLVGTVGIGLLALVLLVPWRRTPSSAVEPTGGAEEPGRGLGLRSHTPASAGRESDGATTGGDHRSPGRPAAPAAPAADLWQTAKLCKDLARVGDPDELPGLLARASALLDATGIVVWVVDTRDGSLRPVSAHGYPPEAIAKIGAIAADADNATAAACRTGELQVVAADSSAPGALAAPMASPGGCVGVMAAEIKAGRENDPTVQASATIIASQLAALVQPAPAAS